MLNKKIRQLVNAFVNEFSVRIAPFAVFLIECAVCFFADKAVLQRHSAALADKLSRRPEKRVYRNVKQL